MTQRLLLFDLVPDRGIPGGGASLERMDVRLKPIARTGRPALVGERSDTRELARISYWIDSYGQILKYKERLLTYALHEAELIASDIARQYVLEADAAALSRQRTGQHPRLQPRLRRRAGCPLTARTIWHSPSDRRFREAEARAVVLAP